MKIKNKGKVYPSPSSSSSSSASNFSDEQVLSVLKLLPATILALASLLSFEDREVLVYMITRSMETTPASSIIQGTKKKSSNSKKTIPNKSNTHKPPVFDCDCFDCYTSYWFRWDSSPNRELIHQVIEAFEEHLTNGEKSKKSASRAKKKERMTRRIANASSPQNKISSQEIPAPDMDESCGAVKPQDDEPSTSISPLADGDDATATNVEPQPVNTQLTDEELKFVFRGSAATNHRGLARKVLPDVLGLLNSRLWSFWSPNV